MITRITHFPVFVHDQDEALAFYVNKLGLKLHTDVMFGEEGKKMRWLTVSTQEQTDFEIALMHAFIPEQQALVGKQAPEVPLFCVSTNDCKKTYQELKNNGVTCVSDPEELPWGVSALIKDLYGNIINLVETR